MNRIIIIAFLYLTVNGCSEERKSAEKQLQLLSLVENDKNEKKYEYYPNGGVYVSKDILEGDIMGNYYEFYESGLFKTYQFMLDSLNSIYSISYDTLGNVIEELGDPICRMHINFDYKPDSAHISILISSFPFKNVSTSISSFNKEFVSVETLKHPILAYIETCDYAVLTKNVNKLFEVIKIDCIDLDGNTRQYYDTISFSREHSVSL